MKVQYVSDLHVDENCRHDLKKMIRNEENSDVLVIAGDIAHGFYHGIEKLSKTDIENQALLVKKLESLQNYFKENWKHIIVGYGNHDFYHGCLPIEDYFGHIEEIDGVKFVLSPLFSELSETTIAVENLKPSYYRFVDFNWIKKKNHKLDCIEAITHLDYAMYHKNCLKWIGKELEKSEQKCVVVTHHMPSFQCIDPQYKNSGMNHFFASNLDSFIQKYSSKISYWINAHSHSAQSIEIHGVKVIRNPIGYLEYAEGRSYSNKTFVI